MFEVSILQCWSFLAVLWNNIKQAFPSKRLTQRLIWIFFSWKQCSKTVCQSFYFYSRSNFLKMLSSFTNNLNLSELNKTMQYGSAIIFFWLASIIFFSIITKWFWKNVPKGRTVTTVCTFNVPCSLFYPFIGKSTFICHKAITARFHQLFEVRWDAKHTKILNSFFVPSPISAGLSVTYFVNNDTYSSSLTMHSQKCPW